MTLRTIGLSFLSFMLGLALFAATMPAVSAQDDRAADREAIRAHIDSIFQAFIKKDVAALRATHAENWLGYLEGSREMIKGVDGYMDWNQVDPKSPYGMKSYNFREFDMIFKSDAAFVCFVADVESIGPACRRIARCASVISIPVPMESGFKAAATQRFMLSRWKSSWQRRGRWESK